MNHSVRLLSRVAMLLMVVLALVAPGVTRSTSTATAATTNSTLTAATAPLPPIVISPGTLPGAVGANYYEQQLSASGGDGGPYTFTRALLSPPLPRGLQLSGDGYLSGTPTQAGTFRFTVRASDATGRVGRTTYWLAVVPGTFVIATGYMGVSDFGYGPISSGRVSIDPVGTGVVRSVSGFVQLAADGGRAYLSLALGSVQMFGLPVYVGSVGLMTPNSQVFAPISLFVRRIGPTAIHGMFAGWGSVYGGGQTAAFLDVTIVA